MATTDEIDPRLLRISIEINGVLHQFEGLEMTASGTKYANPNENECEVKIANLDKATRDFLLTETSPFNKNKKRKLLTVEAGRVSTGYALQFVGDITNAVGGQPPDITITIKAATGDYSKGVIISTSQPAMAPLRNIAAQIAKDLGLSLRFEATPKQIANYSYTGSAVKQVEHLGRMGRVNAYIDDKMLVVKNFNAVLERQVRDVSLDSGMIGIPEFTEQGIKVKMLHDNQTTLGGGLRVTSQLNPAANGLYTIFKMGFELASRDTPWYLIPECVRAAGP
jgi:hypothetical protein